MTGQGKRLQEAREARAISLEQAERDTRIIRKYLTALEEDRLDAFPAPVYARGFLKSYANYLGLDAEELLAMAGPRRESGPPVGRPPQRPSGRRGKAPAPPVDAPLTEPTRSRPDRRPDRRRPKRAARIPPGRIALSIAGVVVLVALAGYLFDYTPDTTFPIDAARRPATTERAPAAPSAVNVRMPELRGMDEQEALRRLAELGLVPLVIELPSGDGLAGQVIRQSPLPDQPVGASVVTIVISRGG